MPEVPLLRGVMPESFISFIFNLDRELLVGSELLAVQDAPAYGQLSSLADAQRALHDAAERQP